MARPTVDVVVPFVGDRVALEQLRRRRPGLLWWALRASARGVIDALRQRERDVAVLALFDALEQVSFEFGRSLPNRRRRRVR